VDQGLCVAKFNYTNLSLTATRLVNRFGKTIKKRTIVNSGSDFNPTQTVTDTDIDGVIVAYGLNEIDGSLILTTDKKLLTTSLLELDDRVVDDDIVYSIVSINQIQPSDTTLLYKVQLRR
jgi:hypothetical protein